MSGDRTAPEALSAAIAEAKRTGTSVLAPAEVRTAAPNAEVEDQARARAALTIAAQQADPRVTFETRLVRGHLDTSSCSCRSTPRRWSSDDRTDTIRKGLKGTGRSVRTAR
jgi:hypothetical protein